MAFDASPEELYPEHFPEDEELPVGGLMDREPYRDQAAYGWYFRVDGTTHGFYATEAEARSRYEQAREEAYTDEE